MAITIQWDLLEGAEASIDTSTIDITRSGLAQGITTSLTADPFALVRAVAAAIQTTPAVAPGTIGTWINKLLVRPVQATDQAKIEVTFSGPTPLPKTGVMWLIEDHTTLTVEAEQVDQNGKPLQCVYQGPTQDNVAAALASGGSVPSQITPAGLAYPVTLNPLRPRRQIDISGFIFGPPGAVVLTCVDAVNQSPWPNSSLFAGDAPLPPGYWLCTNASAELSGKGLYGRNPVNVNQMLFQVKASFMTKIRRDWSMYAVYKNVKGLIPPDLATPALDAQRKALINAPYVYGATTGQIAANGTTTFPKGAVNGFLKWGPYPLINWTNIFGI
nr:hypothetical protein [uncultured Rhodopila sp.]